MPIDTHRGNLFSQMVSRRYEKGTIILTLAFMFILPFGIFGLVYPRLSDIDFSRYPYLPSLLAVVFILLVIADYASIVLLAIKWTQEDLS